MDPLMLADHLKRLNSGENNGWYTTVVQSIADLTAEQALWRPSPGIPCIWELAAHIHYWTMRMTEVFEAIRRGEEPSNRSETDWRSRTLRITLPGLLFKQNSPGQWQSCRMW